MDHALRKYNQQKPSSNQSRSESREFPPITSRRQFSRRHVADQNPYSMSNGNHESTDESMSDTDHELGALTPDTERIEEMGLPKEEWRKHLRQKRQQKKLSERNFSTTGMLSKEDARQADKDVIRKLVINTILVLLWYFFSLSISIYNKWMFSPDNLDFHYPLFTTSFHMVVQFVLATVILAIFPSLRPKSPQPKPDEPLLVIPKSLVTPLFYFTRLVPTGATTSLDIGLGNTSLRYITLTFYTMCKSSVLIWVLIFAFVFRLEAPSIRLILIIITMTIGVLMMAFGETAFNATGFALAISASFFSGFRWALTQILLLRHPATSNPFATLFFLAPIMFVTLFVIAFIGETPSAVISGLHTLILEKGVSTAVMLMFIPGCLAFCMIAAEFTLLQRTNVVTLSICGIFKEVVTISAAGIVFHDKLSIVNVTGLIVTILCIACYNYIKVTKMRQEARDKLSKKVDDVTDPDVERGSSSRRRHREVAVGQAAPDDEANVPLMNGDDGSGRR